jgi:hypothetical protein
VQCIARLVDVFEPERGKARLRGGLGKRADTGQRVEQRREEEFFVNRVDDGLMGTVCRVERFYRGD